MVLVKNITSLFCCGSGGLEARWLRSLQHPKAVWLSGRSRVALLFGIGAGPQCQVLSDTVVPIAGQQQLRNVMVGLP